VLFASLRCPLLSDGDNVFIAVGKTRTHPKNFVKPSFKIPLAIKDQSQDSGFIECPRGEIKCAMSQ
jgi:hypothetical protein